MKKLFINKKILVAIVGLFCIALPKINLAQAFEDVVVDSVVVLPIKLRAFNANRIEKKVELNWVIESDKNLSYFVVQRSLNGVHFEDIATIKALPTNNYNLTDNNVEDKNLYYRLESISNDGKSSFSNIILLKYASNNLFDISAYPNPLNGNILNLSIKNIAIGNFVVELKDLQGSSVITKSLKTSFNNTSFALELPNGLTKGVYILNAFDKNGLIHSQKIIIQ